MDKPGLWLVAVIKTNARLDFALTTEAGLHLVEVKGVTLEENGVVRFPDAPTERGVKHIHELQRAVREGLGATLFFVIQMHGVDPAHTGHRHQDRPFGHERCAGHPVRGG